MYRVPYKMKFLFDYQMFAIKKKRRLFWEYFKRITHDIKDASGYGMPPPNRPKPFCLAD